MARIQEYLPEVEAQGPVGQTTPELEQVSMYGRGIESLGKDIGDAYTVIHQRQTQAETSDAFASVAEQRANFAERIHQETNDGTLDVDKVKQEYQDWAEKQADKYSTAGGKDAFVRASSRAGGSLLLSAVRGQTVVAGNKAKDDLTSLMNSNSNLVMKDPTQFDDLRDAQREAIEAQVASGSVSQPLAEKMRQAMDLELSKSAVRGMMQSDYDNIKNSVITSGGKIDPNMPALNSAKQILDGGHFDEILDSDAKRALMQEIRQNQAAAQTAGVQALSQKQAVVGAQGEAFKSQAYEQMRTGKYDPAQSVKAFQAGIITADEQLKLNHLADAQAGEEAVSNPAAYNSIMSRILSPDNAPGHISDPMQIAYLVKKNAEDAGPGSPYIGKGDFDRLSDAIAMVPSNRVNSFNEAQLLERAKSMIGDSDPGAHYKLMQFTNELQVAKQNALKNQQPLGPLLDPSSKDYFGNQLQKYVATPQQILQQQAERARGLIVDPTNVQTRPGVTPTPSSATPGQKFDVNTLQLKDITSLDPKKLTPAQRDAVRTRYRSLVGGK